MNNNLRDGELRTEKAVAMSKAMEVIDRFLSLRRRMDSEGEEIDIKRDFNMDNTTLDEYIALIQSKTQAIDSYSREFQSYMSLLKSLKIDVPDGDLKDLEGRMLAVTTSCDALDRNMQNVVEAFQAVLAPKQPSER